MKLGPPNLTDGADCARRGRAVTVNPFPFDTPDHYRWLADWHEAKAQGERFGSPVRERFEGLATIYRRQAAAISLSST